MKSQNVTLKDLLPGFVDADKGGVVRIAELQSQGCLYLRPWLMCAGAQCRSGQTSRSPAYSKL
jgi:hypothetical protein